MRTTRKVKWKVIEPFTLVAYSNLWAVFLRRPLELKLVDLSPTHTPFPGWGFSRFKEQLSLLTMLKIMLNRWAFFSLRLTFTRHGVDEIRQRGLLCMIIQSAISHSRHVKRSTRNVCNHSTRNSSKNSTDICIKRWKSFIITILLLCLSFRQTVQLSELIDRENEKKECKTRK